MARARERATYEDLRALPAGVTGELVGGELFATPRPAAAHAWAESAIAGDLAPFQANRGRPGGWWLLVEPEVHLGADVVVPDLAGWRVERMPRIPDVAAFDLAPDWVCEVISPRTVRLDRGRKTGVYARARVAHMWLVDPIARTLEIWRLGGEHWLLVATHLDDEKVRAEPFADVELELGRWWIAREG